MAAESRRPLAEPKPRTLAQARQAYSTNSELFWWVFMRVSGLLMVLLVFAHLVMNTLLVNVGDIDFAYVTRRLSLPWIKLFNTALLVLGMLHGANGLRYSIEDYNRKAGRRFTWKTVLWVVTILIMIIGLISLWGIDYSQYDEVASLLNGWNA